MARVLIIEDDEFMRELLRTALEDVPYVVDEAPNGTQGLARQCANPSDVVITDMALPDLDGLTVIRALRDRFPETSVMVISGGGCVAEEQLFPVARTLGVRHTLTKPFHLGDMLRGISELVS